MIIIVAGAFFYYSDLRHRSWNAGSIILVPPKEFEFTNIQLVDPFTQPGSSEIRGKVKNNSKTYVLDALCLNVQVVIYYNGRSKIIESDAVYISLNVPPQQTRDFIAHPHFRSLNSPGNMWDWLCSIGPVKVAEYKNAVRTN